MDLGDLDGDKSPELIYITKGKAQNGNDAFDLRALKRDASGTFKAYAWGTAEQVSIAGLSGPPVEVEALDVNHDGLTDFMIFTAYGGDLAARRGPPAAQGLHRQPWADAQPPHPAA